MSYDNHGMSHSTLSVNISREVRGNDHGSNEFICKNSYHSSHSPTITTPINSFPLCKYAFLWHFQWQTTGTADLLPSSCVGSLRGVGRKRAVCSARRWFTRGSQSWTGYRNIPARTRSEIWWLESQSDWQSFPRRWLTVALQGSRQQ